MKVKTIVLVDYENIKPIIDCEQMPNRTCFYILGNKNSTINFEMLRQTQQYPDKIIWVETEGVGRNNLDFHLAYFLGAFHQQYKSDVKLVVLSKDKGYDNLIRFIQGQGRDCIRVADVNQLKKKKYRVEPEAPKPTVRALISEVTVTTNKSVKVASQNQVLPLAVQKVREVLQKGGKPRKLAKLKNSINSILHPNPHKIDVDQIVMQLQSESFLKIAGDYVQYEGAELVETIEISAEEVIEEPVRTKAKTVEEDTTAFEEVNGPELAQTAGATTNTEADTASETASNIAEAHETITEIPVAESEAVEGNKPAPKRRGRKSTKPVADKTTDAAAPKSRSATTEAKPRAAARRKKKTTEKPMAPVEDLNNPDTYIQEYETGLPPYGETHEILATNL